MGVCRGRRARADRTPGTGVGTVDLALACRERQDMAVGEAQAPSHRPAPAPAQLQPRKDHDERRHQETRGQSNNFEWAERTVMRTGPSSSKATRSRTSAQVTGRQGCEMTRPGTASGNPRRPDASVRLAAGRAGQLALPYSGCDRYRQQVRFADLFLDRFTVGLQSCDVGLDGLYCACPAPAQADQDRERPRGHRDHAVTTRQPGPRPAEDRPRPPRKYRASLGLPDNRHSPHGRTHRACRDSRRLPGCSPTYQ